MKYVVYLRVSTDQQAASGLGIEAQRQRCISFISRSGSCQNVLEFLDHGLSGALDIEKRPALFEAISTLEKEDILLVSSRDRIGRDPIVNAMIERAVSRKQARLISASGDVRDDNDPSSILMRRMVDAFAEYERLIIGARTKDALAVLKRSGRRVGYIPYGYRLCLDNVHIEADEKEQAILKKISEARKDGMSYRKIAKHFSSMSIFNRKGGHWTHVSIKRVMK